MINKILKVAEREFLETVKTKTYVITLFLMPILILGGMYLSLKLTHKSITGERPTKTIGVTDLSNELQGEIRAVFDGYNKANEGRQIILKMYDAAEPDVEAQTEQRKKEIREGALNGYLLIGKDVIEGNDKSYYYMKVKNVIDLETFSTARNLVNTAVRNERTRRRDLSPELIAEIRRSISIEEIDLSTKTGGKPKEYTIIFLPLFFLILMAAGVFGTNQQMLTGVIEEKTARVMEVILATVTPFELMAGKILGLAAAGFTLIFVWGAAGVGTALYRGMTDLVTFQTGLCFIIYFVLGFLLYSSIMAAIGSACNTVKEAQNLMMPVGILFFLPMFVWFFVAQQPDSTLAIVLSFIPPITPMIMMVRLSVNPEISVLQIVLSMALLAVSVPAVMWGAAKVFRTGVLMYGKPPSVRELARWVRYK